MNDSQSLEERLDRLGRELSGGQSVVAGVMERVAAAARPQRRFLPGARALAAFAAAACILVAASIWFSRPGTLYARALQALAEARTVHVTGWTTQVVRRWPLETPREGAPKKHPVEAWFWREEDGTPRSYERFGPVIQVRAGGALREYQQDVDLLFTSDVNPKDYLELFSTLARYLQALEREGLEKRDLGVRNEDGKRLRGLKIVHRNRTEEYWFDVETDLPMQFSRSQTQENGTEIGFKMHFTYDEPVPMEVAEYEPPGTENVRYGGGHENVQLVWRRHVQDIQLRLQEQPLEEPVAVLPRRGRQTFSYQYELKTPDGKYWVAPLDLDQYAPLTVRNFINLRVAAEDGDGAFETWRVPKDLLEEEFPRSDLVYIEGTPWQEWAQFALNHVGLEYVDVVEQRTFWIAHHDGRELKPWRTVNPPVPYIVEGGVVKKGVVRPGIGHQLSPETMHGLFEDFNRIQNKEFTADHPIIVDETGLPRPPKWDRDVYPTFAAFRGAVLDEYFVATDSPYFAREVSRQMARDWYREEFGVTFAEERRPLTIHVVRRRE